MGVNNRQRRRMKKQKRARAAPAPGARAFNEDIARGIVLGAAEAFRFESSEVYQEHLSRITGLSDAGLRPLIDRSLRWWLELGLDRAWNSGWQPADVRRAVGRTLSPAHGATIGSVVWRSAANRPEARTDDRWAAQLEAMKAEVDKHHSATPWLDLPYGIEALSLVLHMPPLPRLAGGARRSSRQGGRAGVVLERVRALLAKAESTTFPEEAEALAAKAQELMARHSIDQAMLHSGGDGGGDAVVGWRIGIDDPYAVAKSSLLDRIATANGCRAVWSKNMAFSTIFGTRDDLEMVEILFTSLLVQATEAMVRAGPAKDRSGRSRTRSFRQSFLLAYADRIGERLSDATTRIVAEGTERHGDRLLPVLARRDEEVQAAVRTAFPQLAQRGAGINNYAGWLAGRAAADVASLAVGEELIAG